MNTKKKRATDNMLIWVAALVIAVAIFYGLDHFVMGIQGLPLSWNLTPAN